MIKLAKKASEDLARLTANAFAAARAADAFAAAKAAAKAAAANQ